MTSIPTHPTGSRQVPVRGLRAGSAVNLGSVLLLVGAVVLIYDPVANPYSARRLT